jgi:transcriptional regulator with XRE-family HTH domain
MVTARQAKPTRMPGSAASKASGAVVRKVAPKGVDVDPGAQLGVRLRHARIANAMRLHDLAEKAGCSESLLSKLENNRANPSINMLHRLASALGTNLAWLVAPSNGDDHAVVLRRADRPTLHAPAPGSHGGITLQALIARGQGHLLQGQIHILEPGARSDGAITHEGEELGLVLEGTLDLTVNRITYRLSPGDSFHFDSSQPHAYGNSGKSVTQVAWINTPPTY